MKPETVYDRALPCAIDAERFILGAVLTSPDSLGLFDRLHGLLKVSDFSLEKHKRLWHTMSVLSSQNCPIDRVTVAQKLQDFGQLHKVDGLAYICELDNGLPQIYNLDAYVDVVREKSQLRRLITTANDGIQAAMSGELSAAEVRIQLERNLAGVDTAMKTRGRAWSPAEIIREAGGPRAFLAQQRRRGLPLPWPKLSRNACGIAPRDMFILAARPSHGKTAAMLNICRHAVELDLERTVIFSFEQSRQQLIDRLIADIASIDGEKLQPGSEEELDFWEQEAYDKAAARIEAWGDRLRIVDDLEPTVPAMRSKMKELIQEDRRPGLTAVDYIQRMKAYGRFSSRQEAIAEISSGLTDFKTEFDQKLLVLAQLSRDLEKTNRRPVLSDLKESGALEQDGDKIAFIHPIEDQFANPDTRNMEMILAKHRNGPTGLKTMTYFKRYLRFVEKEQV